MTGTGGERELLALCARVDAVARADAETEDTVASRRAMGGLRLGLQVAGSGAASPPSAPRWQAGAGHSLDVQQRDSEAAGADSEGPAEALLEELLEEAISDMLAASRANV